MNILKPCPFCGSMSQTVKTVWRTWRFVACKCKAAGAPAKDDEGAIANWNARAVTITEYATDKIADLQAENDKLVVKFNSERIYRQNVEAENDRLRELVRDMYDFYCVDENELGFAFQEEVAFSAKVRDRMRELGIEVDE